MLEKAGAKNIQPSRRVSTPGNTNHEMGTALMVRDRIIRWQDAYAHRGVGSARDRRRDVEYIYSEAAPVPGQIADPPSNEFLREIRILIRNSVEQAGGRLEGLPALAAPRS